MQRFIYDVVSTCYFCLPVSSILSFGGYGLNMECLRSQQSSNILCRTDDFYVRVCSSTLPPPNKHCQFMLYFPHSLRMAMDLEVSLHKIIYPYKWRTFPDDMDLWISFRFVKGADAVSNDEEVSDSESEGEIEMESGDEIGDMDVGVGDDASLDSECEGLLVGSDCYLICIYSSNI